jgi:hypothetical protein
MSTCSLLRFSESLFLIYVFVRTRAAGLVHTDIANMDW